MARGLKERLCADDVRLHEGAWIDDGPTVVRLGGEIHDDVRPRSPYCIPHGVDVRDIGAKELVTLAVVAFDVRECCAIPGVREEIDVHDLIRPVAAEPVADEVGADEPCPARYKEAHSPGIIST